MTELNDSLPQPSFESDSARLFLRQAQEAQTQWQSADGGAPVYGSF